MARKKTTKINNIEFTNFNEEQLEEMRIRKIFLDLQEDLKSFNKLTQKQKELTHVVKNHDIILITGPAGTAKTFSSCYIALQLLADSVLNNKKINKIILCKPLVESGEKLGFLPGKVEDKINPFIETYINSFKKIIKTEFVLENLFNEGFIEFRPIAYMRGATYDDAILILDEVQNCDLTQLMLFITRMGNDSKIIMSGDVSQYDIQLNRVGVNDFREIARNVAGFIEYKFDYTDILRNKILIELTENYEKFKYEKQFMNDVMKNAGQDSDYKAFVEENYYEDDDDYYEGGYN